MLAMLQARYAGDEPTVHRILTEYREQRCRRRPKSDTPLEAHPETTEHKAKRRRSVTASWQEDYCRVFPQVSQGVFSLFLKFLGVE
jgi:hypothetical protein